MAKTKKVGQKIPEIEPKNILDLTKKSLGRKLLIQLHWNFTKMPKKKKKEATLNLIISSSLPCTSVYDNAGTS